MLQALKSLVTQAKQQPTFDLWDGLTQLVAKETRRRQQGQNTKQQTTHKGKGRNTQSWKSDTHWPQDRSSKQVVQTPSNDWKTVKWKPRSTDWQSALTDKISVVDSAHALAQALEDPLNSENAFVCIADDTEQYEEMVALALGERNAMITILAQNSVHIPDTDDIHTVKVPGTLRQGLQIRTCWLHPFGQGSPELKTKKFVEVPKIQQAGNPFDSRFQPRAKGPSWVLRLIAPYNYQKVNWSDWNTMIGAPGASARSWATEMVGRENGHLLGDTFRFELQNGADLRGLLRIQQQDVALTLLKASGTIFNGQRWFIEQVAGEYNDSDIPPEVLWLPENEGERWDSYATRARRMSQHGIILGRHQLGLRVTADDSRPQEKTSVWRVDHVPKGWQFEEVLALLEAVQFTDIEVMEKQWRRTCSSWLIRAKYPGNDVILQPVVTANDGSNVELSITKEARRRQLQGKSNKLKQETRVSYGKQQQHTVSSKRGETQAQGLFDIDACMETERTKRQKLEGAAPKSAAEKPQSKEPHAPHFAGWMPRQAIRVPNDGKGDCLFIAVQQALSVLEPTKKRTSKQIRAFTAAHMAQHSAEYEALWDGRGPGGKEEDDDSWGTTFQDYLQGMRMAGCWGTYLECFALARGLNRDLLILSEDGEVLNFEQNCTEPAICLFFSEKAGHYEYLQGPVEAELRQWAIKHQGRGGAKVRGGGCDRSVRLSDFASSSNRVSVKTRPSQAKSGRISKNLSKRSVRLSDFASEKTRRTEKSLSTLPKYKSDTSASKQFPVSSTGKDKNAPPAHQWICNKCNAVIASDSVVLLSKKRCNHIRRQHANEKENAHFKFSMIKPEIDLLVKDVPHHLRAWSCSYCGFGLEKKHSPITRYHVAKKHIKTCGGRGATMKKNLKRLSEQGCTLSRLGVTHNVARAARRRLRLDLIQAEESAHELVEMLCPRKENKLFQKTSQHSVNFTCRLCTATWTCLSKIPKTQNTCPGHKKSRFRNLRMKAKWWALLRQLQPAHLVTCIQTWRLTRDEIIRLDADARKVVSTGWKKTPPLTSCVWFHNLVEDGDVEPNPGPLFLALPSLLYIVPGVFLDPSHFGNMQNPILFRKGTANVSLTAGVRNWKDSIGLANAKFRRLVQQGVEPNPGPRHHLLAKLSAVFCNCGSHDAVYAALGLAFEDKPHIIGLCETHANPWQGAQLRKYLHAAGYKAWCISNPSQKDSRGREYTKGGILLALRQDVKGCMTDTFLHEDGETIHADLGSTIISIGWRRPSLDATGKWEEDLAATCLHATSTQRPWLCFADWNLTPDENPFVAAGAGISAVTSPIGAYLPTRWNANRCIDYCVSNMVDISSLQAKFYESRLSDHKMIQFTGQFKLSTEVGRLLKPTRSCAKPEDISTEEWRKALDLEWQKATVPVPMATNTEEEWKLFNKIAEQAALQARKKFRCKVQKGPFRPKGSSPELIDEGSHTKTVATEGTFRQRSLAKFVGRLSEALRPGSCDPKLMANLTRTWPREISRNQNWAQALGQAQQLLKKEKHRLKNSALNKWKLKMQQDGKTATKWLKQTLFTMPPALLKPTAENSESAKPTCSTHEALQVMIDFWQTIWHRPCMPEELTRLRNDSLTAPPGPPMANTGTWKLNVDELVAVARQKKTESAGPDGWSAAEVRHWPPRAWQIFIHLWQSWVFRNEFPEVWRHSRQVMIPKTEGTFGQVSVADMRPIAIQPVLCRIISSAFAQRIETKEWLQNLIPDYTHGAVAGRDVATALLTVQETFAKFRLLVSLDQAKCFDHVIPELALGHLAHAGMHPEWIRHFTWTWSHQKRWLQFGRATSDSPQHVFSSIPQGCAIAPLALVVLMNEASQAIQRLSGSEDTLTQSIYVDDRALAVSTPQLAVKAINAWGSWSSRLGLKENLNKMQIVCKQWSQKQTMISLGINEKHFVSSTRILGLDFVADSSNPCPTEQRRKAVALRILPRLQVLPMSRSFKEVLYRTRCQTIISWGCWMTGHNPDFDSAWITQLKKVLGAHRMASRALWTLLQGHWVSPLLTANIACVSHFIRSLNFWHSRQVFVHDGAWVSRVRDILQKAGFEQISFGHFRHPTWGDHQFCNQFWKQTSKNVAHQLREIWRKSLFVFFLPIPDVILVL